MEKALTHNDFLGGRLRLAQPAQGYRAGVDPVLLAAAVPAVAGQSVLDLGCGAGTALFCLATRVAGLTLCGVEVQTFYADLARANAATNGLDATIHTADIAALPAALRQEQFDHVIANPPYFDRSAGTGSADEGRDMAFGGATAARVWAEVAARRLRSGGHFSMIQRIERLPETLAALPLGLGSVVVRPIGGRTARAPERFVVQAKKGGRAAFRLMPALVMHAGARHERDEDSYGPEAKAILRDAAAWAI